MHKERDKKRQHRRQDKRIYKTDESSKKPKFYALDMFPYPSGAGLHVWHPKWYVATDTLARMKILQWYNVLHPMGRDAFGLPAEQYAIKNKVNPKVATDENIDRYKKQLEIMGFTYDWEREVNTTDSWFYKWTQWTFIQLYNHYYDDTTQKAKPIEQLSIPKWLSQEDENEYKDRHRLAFMDYKAINRCPSCKTWLANEDLEDGKCERCGSDIEQKPMRQRVIRITDYAERLLDWLDNHLPERPENIKEMQRHRIGKTEWTEMKMNIDGHKETINIYTTRIDTVYGMSYVALAPEHPLVDKITTKEQKKQVETYKDQAKKKTDLQRTELEKDKTWVFTWAYVINPFTNEKIPVRVADYVLAWYGTGAVMAVPAHDERDFTFAKKYSLPIKNVVAPIFGKEWKDEKRIDGITAILFDPNTQEYGYLERTNPHRYVQVCGWLDKGETHEEATIREIKEETGIQKINKILKLWDTYHSRYYHPVKNDYRFADVNPFLCIVDKNDAFGHNREDHEQFDLVRSDAKTFLKKLEKTLADAKHLHEACKRAVTKAIEEWYDTTTQNKDTFVPIFPDTKEWILYNSEGYNGMFVHEAIKTMQQWLQKKWIGGKKTQYKLQDRVFSRQRYRWEPIPMIHTTNWVKPVDESQLPITLPDVEHYEPTGTEEWPLANITDWVNTPEGKRETNTMPQRAWSSRYRLRYIDPKNNKILIDKDKEQYRWQVDTYVWWLEHATRHLIYARFWYKFLKDIDVVSHEEPFKKLYGVGLVMAEDGRKMSKRRWNVVNPDEVIEEYGADAFRTYEMFMWPFENEIARSTESVKWVKKFLDKVWKLQEKTNKDADTKETQSLLHKTIKKVTEDIEHFKFNTAISQLMILVNKLQSQEAVDIDTYKTLTLLISPFAPHMAEEIRCEVLWEEFSIFTKAERPQHDEKLLQDEIIKMAVQLNGKVRWTVEINPQATQEEVMKVIQKDPKLAERITHEPKKVIYIAGKIINIIL